MTDYAHAFARSEKFDAMKGETIIRDVFTAQYGRTMNATRETLLEREKNLPEDTPELALQSARQTLEAISTGETEPFYKAYDRETDRHRPARQRRGRRTGHCRQRPAGGGQPMKSDANPMQSAHQSPRCTALSKRSGFLCKNPAVRGWTVCRMHGARGGHGEGAANPAYRHGMRSREFKDQRGQIAILSTMARGLI